jgi:hypothetical protein
LTNTLSDSSLLVVTVDKDPPSFICKAAQNLEFLQGFAK